MKNKAFFMTNISHFMAYKTSFMMGEMAFTTDRPCVMVNVLFFTKEILNLDETFFMTYVSSIKMTTYTRPRLVCVKSQIKLLKTFLQRPQDEL